LVEIKLYQVELLQFNFQQQTHQTQSFV